MDEKTSRHSEDCEDSDSGLRKYIDGIVEFLFRCYISIRWIWRNSFDRKSDNVSCLVGKTAIVTGGNSGIGFATSVLLASRGCRVIIACRRDCGKEIQEIINLTGNTDIIWKPLDLCSLAATRAFAQEVMTTEKKIDILINNAGIGATKKLMSDDGLNCVMQTNCFGPFLLTHLLIDHLKSSGSARIVFLSSGLAANHCLTLNNLNYEKGKSTRIYLYKVYANSKVCNIIIAQEFARKLKEHGIIVNSADPGVAETSIFESSGINAKKNFMLHYYLRVISFLFARDPLEAAQTSFHLSTSGKTNISGEHFFKCKPFIKPKIVNNQKLCDQIWEEIERLVSINR